MKTMRNMHYHQRGIGLIGLIVGLGLIIVFTSMFVNVVPLYVENFGVKSTLKDMANERQTRTMNNIEIKKKLMKRLNLSGIGNVNKKNVTVHRLPDSMVLQVAYEVRTQFLANIDFVIKFDDKEEVVP